jgi:hypothetical protein
VADVAFGGGKPKDVEPAGVGMMPPVRHRAKQTFGNAVKELKPPKLSDIPIN